MPTPPLRAVGPDESGGEPKSLVQAAMDNDRRALLAATQNRVAEAVASPNTPPRDLAALSRRLMELSREIEALDLSDGDDAVGIAAATPDEAWDESAI